MKKIFILLSFFMVFQVAMAHRKGHVHSTNSENNRVWYFNDQSIASEGSLLLVKEGKVFIEKANKIVSFDIDKLSPVDQEYINKKVEQLAAINLISNKSKLQEEKSDALVLLSISNLNYWILIVISIVLLLLIYLIAHKYMNPRVRSVIELSFVMILLIIVVACGSDQADEVFCTETTWYEDADGDGLGNSAVSQSTCEQPTGYVADNSDTDDTDSTNGGSSSTALAYDISFLRSSFSQFSNVSYVDTDDTYFYVESNGLPNHQMMVGITTWIERFPTPFNYTTLGIGAWAFPLNPEYDNVDNRALVDELHKGAIGIAANGVPIFNPYNASGELSYDIGELDAYGGHSGNGDDYHYHYPPTHLSTTTGDYPIGFVFDGFPLYGITEPDGSEATDLDEHFGHEDANGYYHYHTSDAAPYMTPTLRGIVEVDMEGIAENQIIPQPVGMTNRGLDDVVLIGGTDSHEITDLDMNETNNGYTLSYTGTKNNVATNGTIEYSWDDAGEFAVIFTTDTSNPTNTTTITYNGDPGEIHSDAYGYNGGSSSSDFTLTSDAVVNNVLLDTYKCETSGVDLIQNSIPLAWSNIPDGTNSLAIIMYHYPNPDDASDPEKDPNQYLLLWGIDPSVTEIAYGAADDGTWYMGSNKDGTAISYTSPCSPTTGTHEYKIIIYALSETPVSLPTASSLSVDYGTLYDAISTVTTLGTAELTFNSVTE